MSITRNCNFTNLKCKLEELGVKNNNFIMEVEDKDVLSLDPFDENLTEREKRMVLREARTNLWYFLSECTRIKCVDKTVPFDINLANLKALHVAKEGFNTYLTTPRQLYGTVSFCAFILWKCLENEFNPDFQYSIITDNKQSLDYMFDRMKHRIQLPVYFNTFDTVAKYTFIDCDELINILDNKERGRKVKTYPIKLDFIFIDDFEHFNCKVANKVNILIEKVNKGDLETQFIFKSTVGRHGNLARSAADIIAMTSDRFRNELFDIGELRYSRGIFYIHENYKILVDNPEDWYMKMCKMLNMNKDLIRTEILCSRIKNSEVILPEEK